MRILYVVSRWRQPTETFVRREVEAARRAGNDIHVLSLKRPPTTASDDPPVTWLGPAAIALHAVQAFARQPLSAARMVVRAALASSRRTVVAELWAAIIGVAATAAVPRVDWVHAHFAWVSATSADAFAGYRRMPFSVMPHAHDVFENRLIDRHLERKLCRAALVVVESDAIRQNLEQRFGCEPRVLRMGVPEAFVVDRIDTSHAERSVLSVGSLHPKKGHDVLIRAVGSLPSTTRCLIAGEGEERPAIEALIAELGLQDRVKLLGTVQEGTVLDLLDQASIFCLASRVTPHGDRDGVPNVLIEAMARGVPVVSTCVSGIPDLLGDGRGLLVPPEDDEELAAALRDLLTDEERRRSLATTARDHVREHYTTDRNWQELEMMIERAL